MLWVRYYAKCYNTKNIIFGSFYQWNCSLVEEITKLAENCNVKEVVTGCLSRMSSLDLNLMDEVCSHECKWQELKSEQSWKNSNSDSVGNCP